MFDVFQLDLRPVCSEDKALIAQFVANQWGDDLIVSRGKLHRASSLPGFITLFDGDENQMQFHLIRRVY